MKLRSSAAFRVFSSAVLAVVATTAIAACGSSATPAAKPAAATTDAAATANPAAKASSGVTISTAASSAGTHLVAASGRAVYLWVADPKDKSTCSGACAGDWPPVTTKGAVRAAKGVRAAKLGTITRAGGVRQVTYAGHPLYYFAGDMQAGATDGQGSDGFGAKWWLVSTSGKAITASASAATGASASSSSSSSSNGGW